MTKVECRLCYKAHGERRPLACIVNKVLLAFSHDTVYCLWLLLFTVKQLWQRPQTENRYYLALWKICICWPLTYGRTSTVADVEGHWASQPRVQCGSGLLALELSLTELQFSQGQLQGLPWGESLVCSAGLLFIWYSQIWMTTVDSLGLSVWLLRRVWKEPLSVAVCLTMCCFHAKGDGSQCYYGLWD